MKLPVRLLLLVAAAMSFGAALRAQVAIVANPGLKAAEISRSELRDVFTGAASSIAGNVHVTPILLKEGATHDEFLNLYIGKSDAAFRATWRSLIFSGQGIMPRSLPTDAEVVSFVAHTPGAIGYISRTSPHEGVKVLAVH